MFKKVAKMPAETWVRHIAGPQNAAGHAIFFHGLRGSIASTWGDPATAKFWPAWFAEDLPGLAVWAVKYNAPLSAWFGGPSMSLVDQAANLRSILTLERALRSGNIAFVGYSLGGLIAKAVLRSSGDKRTDSATMDFHRRIILVATLGTPHSGSELANFPIVSFLVNKSKIARCLDKNQEYYLRDLNNYFADWMGPHHERGLAIGETVELGLLGPIVSQGSANPGTPSYVTTAESHSSIVKVNTRDDHVYRALLEALRPIAQTQLRVSTPTGPVVKGNAIGNDDDSDQASPAGATGRFQALLSSDASPGSATLTAIVVDNQTSTGAPQALIDAEIEREVQTLIRGRFIPSFPRTDAAKSLMGKLLFSGQLSAGSPAVCRDALAWCARVLATEETRVEAERALEGARAIGQSSLVMISEAFISALSDRSGGLAKLSQNDTIAFQSAAFFIGTRARPGPEALEWARDSGLLSSDLEPEARQQHLTLLVLSKKWDEAYAAAPSAAEIGDETPQYLQLAAIARLAYVTPTEVRDVILAQVPFHPRTLPLASDDEAMEARKAAIKLFDRFAPIAARLGCQAEADLASDLALWLRLRDPRLFTDARSELDRSKDDARAVLRRLSLLLDYGIHLDLDAVEREVTRQVILSGGQSVHAAAARFSLAFTQGSPGDAAVYLRKYRAEMEPHLAPGALSLAEVELLARAGQGEEAAQVLAAIPWDQIDETARSRAASLVTGLRSSEDELANHIARYDTHPTLADLLSLTEELAQTSEWAALRKYAAILFEQTRDVGALTMLARALSEVGDFRSLAELLETNQGARSQSHELRLQWAWTLWRLGRLAEAGSALDAEALTDENVRILRTNIAITSGRWPDLVNSVEEDFAYRAELSPHQLLRAAQLAQAIGSPRGRDLIKEATSRANDDPAIYAGAYALASSGGWEDSEVVGKWLHEAVRLSGDDGPMRSVDIKELLDQQPDWAEGQREVQNALFTADLPLFAAARLLNTTHLDLQLRRSLSNLEQVDGRKRPVIPVRLGNSKPHIGSAERIVLDPSALLSLLTLGSLKEAVEAAELVVVPHGTLGWLFQERQKTAFHQPSRVSRAQQVRDGLATKRLQPAKASVPIPGNLESQVGTELGALLAEAAELNSETQAHRVIRARPISKIGSFAKEQADVSGYEHLLNSCGDVIKALDRCGALSAEEVEEALTYLTIQENPEKPEHVVPPGSCLYLDGLDLGFLQHCNVLERLATRGFTVYVSQDAIDEQDGLLAYDRQAAETAGLIEEARGILETGIRTGKIVVGATYRATADDEAAIEHPSLDVFELADRADVIIVDDRALSKYDNVQTSDRLVQVCSVYEFLRHLREKGQMSASRFQALLSRARHANFAFLPFEPDELSHQLARTSQINGVLVETFELRIIREHLDGVRLSAYLQMPLEAPWLLQSMDSIRLAARGLWEEETSEQLCAARSRWLLDLYDLRGWSHRMGFSEDGPDLNRLYANQLVQFIVNSEPGKPSSVRYQSWINQSILPDIKLNYPKIYAELLRAASDLMEQDFSAGEGEQK